MSEPPRRPQPPTHFDHTPESWYEHNKYFNEAEKYINYLEAKQHESIIELLKSMDKDRLQELLKTVAIIVDPLSQELMRKAAEP